MARRLLVDCGPDLREQLLDARTSTGSTRVIVTHDHADHCHGIDDLRPLSQALGGPVPLYARADVLERLASRFAYIFKGTRASTPRWREPVRARRRTGLGRCAMLRFVDQPHGGITSLGMRIDEGGRVGRLCDRFP